MNINKLHFLANDENAVLKYEDLSLYAEDAYINLLDDSIFSGIAECS